MEDSVYIKWFDNLSNDDVDIVGGKNASLGEMINQLKPKGIRAPEGFATTAKAYWDFVDQNNIRDKIQSLIDELNEGRKPLAKVGKSIRRLFLTAEFPENMMDDIVDAYRELCERYSVEDVDVAVRSSATAEDLPDASFAGQQETFLNVSGEKELAEACRKCFASLFTDRAISYREDKQFDHMEIALSVGIQKMIRSDKSAAGVMFTIDPETGFKDVVVINGAWGLGENVVQGSITPDEYNVFKPILSDDSKNPLIEKTMGEKEKMMIYAKGGSQTTKNIDTPKEKRQSYVLEDEEIIQLARWARTIESHYGKPMDIEWAKDGETQRISIVQARPETVQSQKSESALKTYRLKEKGEKIVTGLSIGEAVSAAKACVIHSVDQIDEFEDNTILVTEMTDPDWAPIMKRAAGIITDRGGRTCHAAIVSRELGIPAIVGTNDATEKIQKGREITLSCAEGDKGFVYDGILEYEEKEIDLNDIPKTRTRIMMNIASPDAAFRWRQIPAQGIGLARMEFIINNIIKIHPLALLYPDRVDDPNAIREIERLTRNYTDKKRYFIDHLARGLAKIAASQYPEPVIVRMSDFKTNEYADLIGGRSFEPEENNPMLGFRGASRYYSDHYREGFGLECQAVKKARDDIGLDNIIVMIPFCRTLEEADKVLETMKTYGLEQNQNGLEVYVMCEVPSNVVLAEQFAQRFDGFSIGSNDLTQLVLGVDRDSSLLSHLFDERNPAIKKIIENLIEVAHRSNRKVGICGQAPSDYPEFATFLVDTGIDSISLNPDSILDTVNKVADAENNRS